MSEVVLVVLGHPDRRDGLFAASRHLAVLMGGARIRALMLPPPAPIVSAPPPQPDMVTESIAPEASITATVDEHGSRADFIVVAQPDPQDDRATRHAFRTAVFQTGRPVLMVPATEPVGPFGQRVAIAWRDDAGAAKALIPALRILAGADEVHLFAGVHAGAPTPACPPVLIEHGVRAELHVLAIGAEPLGQVLLARTREIGADMLVMGAFTHGPIRNMLLGGLTRYVVAHAHLAVLMRH
jgi:nucleotide-binding universal stress UspA family protein